MRWRFQCPAGHTSVEAINGHFLCRSCERHEDGHDGTYHEVVDRKRDQRIDREDLARLEEEQIGTHPHTVGN